MQSGLKNSQAGYSFRPINRLSMAFPIVRVWIEDGVPVVADTHGIMR